MLTIGIGIILGILAAYGCGKLFKWDPQNENKYAYVFAFITWVGCMVSLFIPLEMVTLEISTHRIIKETEDNYIWVVKDNGVNQYNFNYVEDGIRRLEAVDCDESEISHTDSTAWCKHIQTRPKNKKLTWFKLSPIKNHYIINIPQ